MIDAAGQVLAEFTTIITTTATTTGLIWLVVTLAIYTGAIWINHRAGGNPLLHPLLLTATGVIALTTLLDISISDYQQYAGLLHWLLGPATVALALPMYAQWQKVQQLGWRLILAIAVGGIVAPLFAWVCLFVADAPLALQMTMLAKSITTPLAMESSRLIGGIPALAAVFVIITGIVGAIVAPVTFRLFQVTDPQAQGVALGAVAHAVGTAKALSMGEDVAAMASLGLCLNGIMTAIVLPLLFG
ncbi:LrgB family protein [Salinimonas chungwhensis]|uniref:LrgB family protein n=1 Tax=Salinimonas chungwhensis TaxID=265425 RepID=UPI000367E13B|nr:LrgB family protein [Salinimonas chungwhensis]